MPAVIVKDHPTEQGALELHHQINSKSQVQDYPVTLVAHKDLVKSAWLKEIQQNFGDVITLPENATDDLQLTDNPAKDNTSTQPQSIQLDKMSRRYSAKLVEGIYFLVAFLRFLSL